jgi:hypothetical protein
MQNSVEIVGVANRSAASSQKAAKELDIPKAYNDWTEIIADKTIDAVCIGTWLYTAGERTRCAGGGRGVDGRVVAQLVWLD